MVNSQRIIRALALDEREAVFALSTSEDLRWESQLWDRGAAVQVGSVLAGELESDGLDIGVLAEVEVGDVDVLVGVRVRGCAAVSGVGLRSGESERKRGEESGGGCEVLHFECGLIEVVVLVAVDGVYCWR